MLLLRLETVATRSRKGRFECAWACTAGAVKEVLVGLRDVGYAEGVAWALLAAATALLARGIDEPAAKLLGAAERSSTRRAHTSVRRNAACMNPCPLSFETMGSTTHGSVATQ
jgi:hypothetical protein